MAVNGQEVEGAVPVGEPGAGPRGHKSVVSPGSSEGDEVGPAPEVSGAHELVTVGPGPCHYWCTGAPAEVRVGAQGRVAIPAVIRHEHGLGEGEPLRPA